jgi:hypothetical protein
MSADKVTNFYFRVNYSAKKPIRSIFSKFFSRCSMISISDNISTQSSVLYFICSILIIHVWQLYFGRESFFFNKQPFMVHK